jgi:preprotein translocase subunit SecG
MFLFLLIFHAFISVLLIAAVLLQTGKGSSLANIFGGGGGMESVFGAETPTVLNKMTTILAVIFIVTSLLLATIPGKLTRKSILKEEVKTETQEKPAPEQLPVQDEEIPPVTPPKTEQEN